MNKTILNATGLSERELMAFTNPLYAAKRKSSEAQDGWLSQVVRELANRLSLSDEELDYLMTKGNADIIRAYRAKKQAEADEDAVYGKCLEIFK